jgi:hypothetical protein
LPDNPTYQESRSKLPFDFVIWVTRWIAPWTYPTRDILSYVNRQGGCIMVSIRLPNFTATFIFTVIAVLLIVGLLFWAVSHV